MTRSRDAKHTADIEQATDGGDVLDPDTGGFGLDDAAEILDLTMEVTLDLDAVDAGEPAVTAEPPGPEAPVTGAPLGTERAAGAELADLAEQFRRSTEARNTRAAYVADGGFWCGLVFETTADMERFVAALALADGAREDQWLDGYAVAQALGIDLAPARVKYRATYPAVRRWAKFALKTVPPPPPPGAHWGDDP